MELTTQMWSHAIDQVAESLLDAADIRTPPVDAIRVARKLNLQVAYDAAQMSRGRHVRLGGKTAILIRPEERPERLQWSVAHEMGEYSAHHVFEQLGLIPDDSGAASREEVANQLASRILLPTRWFFQDVRELDADLWELKRLYRTASFESIAWRLLASPTPSIVTILDQGKVSARRGNLESGPVPLMQIEREVWETLHHSPERHAERQSEELRVQGWSVIEPGWQREVLRLTLIA